MAGAAAGSSTAAAAAAAAAVSFSRAARRAVPRAAAAASSSSSSSGRCRVEQGSQAARTPRFAADSPFLPPLFLCPALSPPPPVWRNPTGPRRRFISSSTSSQAASSASSQRESASELEALERKLQAGRNTLRLKAPRFNAYSPPLSPPPTVPSRLPGSFRSSLDPRSRAWLDTVQWLLPEDGGPLRDVDLSAKWQAEDDSAFAKLKDGPALRAMLEAAHSAERCLETAQARAPNSPLSPAQKAQVLVTAHAELAACRQQLMELLAASAPSNGPKRLRKPGCHAVSRCMAANLRATYVLGPAGSTAEAPGSVAAVVVWLDELATRLGRLLCPRHYHGLVSRAARVGDMHAVRCFVDALHRANSGRTDEWLQLWRSKAVAALTQNPSGDEGLRESWMTRIERRRTPENEALVPTSHLCSWLLHLFAAKRDSRAVLRIAAISSSHELPTSNRSWLRLAGLQPCFQAALATMASAAAPDGQAGRDLASLTAEQLLNGLIRQFAAEADMRGVLRTLRFFGVPTGGMRPALRPSAPTPTAQTYAPLAIYFSAVGSPGLAMRFARLALQYHTERSDPFSDDAMAARTAVQRAVHSLVAVHRPSDALAFALTALRFSPRAEADLRRFALPAIDDSVARMARDRASGALAAPLDLDLKMYPVLLHAASSLSLRRRVRASRALLKELYRIGLSPNDHIRRAMGYLLISTVDENTRLLRRIFAPLERGELEMRVAELTARAELVSVARQRHNVKAHARMLARYDALLAALDSIGFRDYVHIAGDTSPRARMMSRRLARERASMQEALKYDEEYLDEAERLSRAPRAVATRRDVAPPAAKAKPDARPRDEFQELFQEPRAVEDSAESGTQKRPSRTRFPVPSKPPADLLPSIEPAPSRSSVSVASDAGLPPLMDAYRLTEPSHEAIDQDHGMQEIARMLVEQETPFPRQAVSQLYQAEIRSGAAALQHGRGGFDTLRRLTPPSDTATHIERETDISRELSSSAYAMRMRVYAVLWQDFDSAVRLFYSMLAHNVRPTMLHISPLVEGLVEVDRLSEAQRVLDEAVPTIGLAPTLRLHTALIRGYGRQGDWDSVRRELRRLRYAGLPVDMALQAMLAYARSMDSERRLTAVEAEEQDASIEELLATGRAAPRTQRVLLHFDALMRTWRFLSAQRLISRALNAGMRRSSRLRDQVHRSGHLIKRYREGYLRGPPEWARGEDGALLARRQLSAEELAEAAVLQQKNRKRVHEFAASERFTLERMRAVRREAVRLAFDALVTLRMEEEVRAERERDAAQNAAAPAEPLAPDEPDAEAEEGELSA